MWNCSISLSNSGGVRYFLSDATDVNTAFTEITEISFAGVVKIAVSLHSLLLIQILQTRHRRQGKLKV